MSGAFLTGAALLVEGAWLHGHGVLIEAGRIAAVLPEDAGAGMRAVLPAGSLLAPGLIDVQVNGGGGVLFNDAPTQAGARAIAAAHRALGTTSILATLITDTAEVMRQAAAVAAEPEAGVLGLHFEGPFLSPARTGVHRPALMRAPAAAELALLKRLGRGMGAVVVTLAPEMVDDPAIALLAQAGVAVCAGHSEASFDRMAAALAAGVRGFTHVFNAMPPLAARAPGVAAAALLDGESWCGVIADGIHVHPAMLRVLLAAKPGRTLLVSDAMPPTGTSVERFVLQGRIIHREQGSLRTADGTLAGADICLADAVRFCVRALGMAPARALEMAAAAPADFLGLSGAVGRIAPGLAADLVLLTPALEVLGTWLAGSWRGRDGVLAGRDPA